MNLLTDEEIEQLDCVSLCCAKWGEVEIYAPSVMGFARAIEAKIMHKLREQKPCCYIPDEVIPMFAPPRIRVLDVPLITYHGENHTALYEHPATSAPCHSQNADCDAQSGLSLTDATQATGAPRGWPSSAEYNPLFVGHVDDLFDEAVIEHAEFSRTDLVFIAAARSE